MCVGLMLFNKQPLPYTLARRGEIFMSVWILDHHITFALGAEFQL